jgi:hypothetical protein
MQFETFVYEKGGGRSVPAFPDLQTMTLTTLVEH